MKYDFKTLTNRKYQGSERWEAMYKCNPNVPDDCVPLSLADMEFKNAPEIIEGLKEYLDQSILGYAVGYDDYYKAVISWLKRKHNNNEKKEWIVNTPGVVNAIHCAVKSLTKEGDGIIVFKPVYYPFFKAIEDNERKLINCPLIETNGYYTIDYTKFEELAKEPANKMLIFCSPHNPVGRVWKKEELEKLAKICLDNDIKIVSDELWNDLIMPGHKHTIFASLSNEIEDITITCTAPSKTFNLGGMANSNIIIRNQTTRNHFCETLVKMRSHNINVLGYKTCELAYNKAENWLNELIDIINEHQKIVKSFFEEKHPEIKAYLSEGTYLQWVDFRALGLTPDELEHFMQVDAQFFTDEGYIFGEEGNGYERLNLAVPTSVLIKELNKLDKALVKLKNK